MDKVVKECMVCQTTWDNKRHQPVALPACGHSFCRHCLIKLRNVKEVVECPICRKVLVDLLPEDLPVNWALLQSVDPSPNMEFEEWARASGLTDSTIKKLVSEDLNSRVALKLLNGNDIFELGLTIGQRKILMAIVEELQEPETRKDTQKAPSDGKKQQSSDNNMPLKKEDPEGEDPKSDKKNDVAKKIIIGTAVGGLVGVGAVVAAPFALAAAGFTSAGIAAGSLAASMMSSAAIANGGAIAAGSTVAVLQSIGAVGIPLAANVAIAGGVTAAGLGVGAGAAALGARNKKDTGSEKKNEDNDNEDKPNVKIDKPL